jgi:hypothetical protein
MPSLDNISFHADSRFLQHYPEKSNGLEDIMCILNHVHKAFNALSHYSTTEEEIDRIIGPSHLPRVSDESSFQYIHEIARESLHFLPASILGIVPHATTNDDIYGESSFPAKTCMMIDV